MDLRRDGFSYPTDPTADPHPKECTEACAAVTHVRCRLQRLDDRRSRPPRGNRTGFFYAYTYVYGENGWCNSRRDAVGSIHQTGLTTMTLAYDAAGRLARSDVVLQPVLGYGYRDSEKTRRIALDRRVGYCMRTSRRCVPSPTGIAPASLAAQTF